MVLSTMPQRIPQLLVVIDLIISASLDELKSSVTFPLLNVQTEEPLNFALSQNGRISIGVLMRLVTGDTMV
eukprot:UN13383